MKKVNDGYMINAQGHLVPDDLVKPVDRIRDELVAEIINKVLSVNAQLKELRQFIDSEVSAFVDISLKEYGVSVQSKKGFMQLVSYDGRFKIKIATQNALSFDERIDAAKALIEQCLERWSDGARPEIRAFISRAFRTDRNGNLKARELLGLQKLNSEDKEWQLAMQALMESVTVSGTTRYINFYKRDEQDNKWVLIPVDFAGV